MEIWNQYKDTNYSLSSFGRARNNKSGRILKHGVSRGYPMIIMMVNGKRINNTIHKLMQSAFNLGEGVVDHFNCIKDDNRLENLKVGSSRDNSNNLPCHMNGKLVGATFTKSSRRWRSQIYHNKTIYLGSYKTEQEAHDAYINYRQLHNL